MRSYNSCYKEARPILEYVISTTVPVIFFNLETTGLDPVGDHIIQIAAMKCMVTKQGAQIIDRFSSFVNPGCTVSEFVTKFTGNPAEFFAGQPDLDTVMARASQFFGNTPVVISWTASDFAVPFLENAGFMTGHMIYPLADIDLMKIAQSVCPKNRIYDNYAFRTVADRYDIPVHGKTEGHDARADVEAYIRLFNRMLPDFLTGRDPVKLISAKYFEKSLYVQNLYFETDHGTFHIDGTNGFLVEDTPGFFDTVDADALTQHLLLGYDCKTLQEIVRKAYIRKHTPAPLASAN